MYENIKSFRYRSYFIIKSQTRSKSQPHSSCKRKLTPSPTQFPSFLRNFDRSEALVPIELVADSLSQLATITRQASNNVLYRASTSQNPPRFLFASALSH